LLKLYSRIVEGKKCFIRNFEAVKLGEPPRKVTANLHITKFQAVLERETIYKNILEKGFPYSLSCFSVLGLLCPKLEK
jgi:hypothetical protein